MPVKLRLIIRCVAEYFGSTETELCSERRPRHLTRQRQAYYWLARDITGRSFPVIGRMLGGRDHTTVMHGLAEIDRLAKEDASVRLLLAELKTIVFAAHAALGRLGIGAPDDLDAVAIADRMMNTPLSRLQVTTEELRTLGAAVLNMHEELTGRAAIAALDGLEATSNGL